MLDELKMKTAHLVVSSTHRSFFLVKISHVNYFMEEKQSLSDCHILPLMKNKIARYQSNLAIVMTHGAETKCKRNQGFYNALTQAKALIQKSSFYFDTLLSWDETESRGRTIKETLAASIHTIEPIMPF